MARTQQWRLRSIELQLKGAIPCWQRPSLARRMKYDKKSTLECEIIEQMNRNYQFQSSIKQRHVGMERLKGKLITADPNAKSNNAAAESIFRSSLRPALECECAIAPTFPARRRHRGSDGQRAEGSEWGSPGAEMGKAKWKKEEDVAIILIA